MSSPALSSPVQGASSRGSPAGAASGSSPGVVNPTDSPPIPGTPHSGARSVPRTPASGVSRTPGSAARSGPGGRRSQSVQPSPNRSDLGRGSSQVRAAVGSQGEEAGSGNNANTQIWGTDIHVSETQAAVKRFFLEFTPEGRDEPLYEQLLHQAYANSQYWINLDCGHLRSFDSSLYEKLIRFPTEAITILDVVLTELYTEMFQNRSDFQEVSIVSRPFNLEDSVVMRNLNPSDVDKLVSIKGMVIRSSSIVPDIQRAYFECMTCQAPEEVDIVNGRIAEPTKCKKCQGMAIDLKHNRCLFKDKQMVRLQENPEDIPQGETPMTVSLCAFEDLVDVAKPGDRVEVTGIYRAQAMRVKPTQKTLKSVYRTYIDVIHFKRTEKGRLGSGSNDAELGEDSTLKKDREQVVERVSKLAKDPNIYHKLVESFAPSIYEMDDVKKGLLCQLFGGSNSGGSSQGAGSGRFRGDLNVLLVGDPGVSKSQLLQYVHKIAPRGIYTSGKGSSAVGLTAYVTKDPETKDIVLESGALVLSDRGICCIDEFDKMSDSTRAILHEAMEQQTISVAKAGIICSLNARTSILAAANPINSRYNPTLSVVENMNLPPTLLSRFDLIYLVLDQPNPVADRRLAKHIVSLYYEHPPQATSTVLSINEFAEYVSFARSECHPKLNDDAKSALIEGYVNMRRMSTSKNTISATPRQLESIVRLSEANAKMRLSDTVEVMDVEEAMRLLRVATQSAATDPRTGKIDMDLINTGRSASSRLRTAQLVNLLKDKLDGRLQSGSITFQNLMELVQQEQQEVTTQELQAAIRQLVDDDAVVTSGTGYNITIARGVRA